MVDLSGLESFSNLNEDVAAGGNGPQEIDIDLIHEDPDNGRTEFNQDTLQQLADSIAARGVKSPVSVKPHPSKEGHFILNYGHRRLRASKLADQKTIPAWIDEDFDDIDQAVENIQREDLSARDIARVISRALERGRTKGDIAKQMGKPASYVSDYALFFELPEDIRGLYEDGACTSMRILAMLQRAFKKWPDEVTRFCREGSEFTASAVTRLTDHLKEQDQKPEKGPQGDDSREGQEEAPQLGNDSSGAMSQSGDADDGGREEEEGSADVDSELDGHSGNEESEALGEGADSEFGGFSEDGGDGQESGLADPRPVAGPGTHDDQPSLDGFDDAEPAVSEGTGPVVQVSVDGREGELMLRASEDGKVWVRFSDSSEEEAVTAGLVVLESIDERL